MSVRLAVHVTAVCLFSITSLVLLIIVCLWRNTKGNNKYDGHNEKEAVLHVPSSYSSSESANAKTAHASNQKEVTANDRTKERPGTVGMLESSHVYDVPKSSARLADDNEVPGKSERPTTVVYDVPRSLKSDPPDYDVPRSYKSLLERESCPEYENVDYLDLPPSKDESSSLYETVRISPTPSPQPSKTPTPHYMSPRNPPAPIEKFGSRELLTNLKPNDA